MARCTVSQMTLNAFEMSSELTSAEHATIATSCALGTFHRPFPYPEDMPNRAIVTFQQDDTVAHLIWYLYHACLQLLNLFTFSL